MFGEAVVEASPGLPEETFEAVVGAVGHDIGATKGDRDRALHTLRALADLARQASLAPGRTHARGCAHRPACSCVRVRVCETELESSLPRLNSSHRTQHTQMKNSELSKHNRSDTSGTLKADA